MADLPLLQQTQQVLAALREFAQTTPNAQLQDYLARLESTLAELTTTNGPAIASGNIEVGNINEASDIRIGHVINNFNINLASVLPVAQRRQLDDLLHAWGKAHVEIRQLAERGHGRHIFLSYSRADAEAAFTIRRALEDAGHVVWQDLTAIKGGAEWVKSIEAGVERCYTLVMALSTAFERSEWMQIEYLHAKRRGKPIIPIKVDDSEIPTLLLRTQVIHAHSDFASGVRRLLEAIPPPPAPSASETPVDMRALELRYLDGLLLKHSVWQQVYTPMAGVGQLRTPATGKPATPGRVKMRTAPTTIDVNYLGRLRQFAPKAPEMEAHEPAQAKQYEADIIPAVEEMRRLVILGDPGAGKTTTLWKILSDYALKAKDDARAPLPVLVELGAWGAGDWPTMLGTQLGPLAARYQNLFDDKRLVFLLDGLNELPADHRNTHLTELRQWLEQCQHADSIVAVTCRELDYVGALDLNLPGRVTITPLDVLRIRRFVNAHIEEPGKGDELFWQLAGGAELQAVWRKWEQAGATFDLFWTASDVPRENPNVFSNTSGQDDTLWRDHVRDQKRSMLGLAANPYMLFMMTQVFTETGALPRNRGLLFQTFIDYLLEKARTPCA